MYPNWKGLVLGSTGTVGWGRFVSTPQLSNPHVYFGTVLCCAELYSKDELSFFCSILNHFLIQWWGGPFSTMLVCLGWDEESDRLLERVAPARYGKFGSAHREIAWFISVWCLTLRLLHLEMDHLMKVPLIEPSCWMSASLFFLMFWFERAGEQCK